jgi:hypothetical protein
MVHLDALANLGRRLRYVDTDPVRKMCRVAGWEAMDSEC